jgi:hypothetical protein
MYVNSLPLDVGLMNMCVPYLVIGIIESEMVEFLNLTTETDSEAIWVWARTVSLGCTFGEGSLEALSSWPLWRSWHQIIR